MATYLLSRPASPVLHCHRLCTTEVGGGSPKRKARGRLKSGLFHARSMALVAPVSMAARAGVRLRTPVPFFRSSNPALGRHPRLEAGVAVDDNRKKGANTMAVQTLGARTPAPHRTHPTLHSRTRRLHALLALDGDTAASVHSTRRAEHVRGVTLTLSGGDQAQAQALALAPTEARALACALLSAAEALELVNRRPFAAVADLAQGGAA